MQATTQYFLKRFFINRLQIFFALPKFYAKHLGVKITCPYYILYPILYTCSPREGGEFNQREGYRGNSSQSWAENTTMTDCISGRSINSDKQ
jgi:hypothetical protein